MENLSPMKHSHGGHRKNAGRKRKYGEKTKVLTFRIPISKFDYIKEIIKYILEVKDNEVQDNDSETYN